MKLPTNSIAFAAALLLPLATFAQTSGTGTSGTGTSGTGTAGSTTSGAGGVASSEALFRQLDTNGDGQISRDEFRSGWASLHHSSGAGASGTGTSGSGTGTSGTGTSGTGTSGTGTSGSGTGTSGSGSSSK